jgi:CheY-like chemotaxis protein
LVVHKENPVLVAEDDPNDALLLELAFESAGVRNKVVVVRTGQEVIDYLGGNRAEHPLPCLMILDVKMPGLSGLDVLKWLQGQEQLRRLPAVMLSSSADSSDVERALELGAREFLTKPCDFGGLVALVTRMNNIWIERHCPGRVLGSAEPPEAG